MATLKIERPWEWMTPRERDGLMAEWLGRRVYRGPVPQSDLQLIEERSWCDVRGYGIQPTTELCPFFTTDHAAARLVEDEVARRGLWREYTSVLYGVMLHRSFAFQISIHDAWALLRAEPDQKCLAALRADGVEI